mmetsp:Transcript_19918/g.57208  ORF Transcript_19918/g.57208 Transcript_19918/m.57208 type:complete len:98 (+) Transcript_19918:769-1062(+)
MLRRSTLGEVFNDSFAKLLSQGHYFHKRMSFRYLATIPTLQILLKQTRRRVVSSSKISRTIFKPSWSGVHVRPTINSNVQFVPPPSPLSNTTHFEFG